MTTTVERRGGNSAKSSSKSLSSPIELATLTDLSNQKVRAVTEAVNPLIADAFALFVKTKNFHWHLFGPHFRDYHLLFDEHADAIHSSIDIMAERVRRIGGTTIRSIGHIAELQTVEDNDEDLVPAVEMVRELMEDNTHMAEMIRKAIDICDKSDDSATENQLQEILDQTERRKWFLFELLQGIEDTD